MEVFITQTFSFTCPTIMFTKEAGVCPPLLHPLSTKLSINPPWTYHQYQFLGSIRILLRWHYKIIWVYSKQFSETLTLSQMYAFRMLMQRSKKKSETWWRKDERRRCWLTESLAGCSQQASSCSILSTGLYSATMICGDNTHRMNQFNIHPTWYYKCLPAGRKVLLFNEHIAIKDFTEICSKDLKIL